VHRRHHNPDNSLCCIADPTQRLAQLTGDRVKLSFGWRRRRAERRKIVAALNELSLRSSLSGAFPWSTEHGSLLVGSYSANDGSSAVRRYALLRDHLRLMMRATVCGFQDGRSCGGGSGCFAWSKKMAPAVVTLQGHDPRLAQAQSSWMRHIGLQRRIQTPCARLIRPGKVHLAPFDAATSCWVFQLYACRNASRPSPASHWRR
jgi:hypothetical protein